MRSIANTHFLKLILILLLNLFLLCLASTKVVAQTETYSCTYQTGLGCAVDVGGYTYGCTPGSIPDASKCQALNNDESACRSAIFPCIEQEPTRYKCVSSQCFPCDKNESHTLCDSDTRQACIDKCTGKTGFKFTRCTKNGCVEDTSCVLGEQD
jgi:hypothetical protein